MTVTFDQLRAANLDRMPQYRNAAGETTSLEWSPSAWSNAYCGEIGELMIEFGKLLQLADIIKKVERGDYKDFWDAEQISEARTKVAKEIADCVIYLDLLSNKLGINLGEAVREKFNEVSIRVGATTRL